VITSLCNIKIINVSLGALIVPKHLIKFRMTNQTNQHHFRWWLTITLLHISKEICQW